MAKCAHNQGDYRAEAVDVNGQTQYHYRCNGCDIILRTGS